MWLKMTKPFSQACENNKRPILDKLHPLLTQYIDVLEIGSGTGQHAIHFAQALPHLNWQTSDLPINHVGIKQWIDESGVSNVKQPIIIDLYKSWPINNVDVIYTANTLHIINFELVELFFSAVNKHLALNGIMCIYGPFKYNGQFTSPSNGDFDLWLKERDCESGIRNIEDILALATNANLNLIHDYEMPANNRLLVFKKH